MKNINIAIDGPGGAGKSTLARLLAREMGFLYIDTGALYRTVGLAAIRAGLKPEDAAGVEAMLKGINIDIRHEDGVQVTYLNNENVSEDIRTELVSAYASAVSAIPAVRDFLLNIQRDTAASYNVVMDGRDIGTVILPDADIKIFLTASPEERAMRRYRQNMKRGDETPFEEVLEAIIKRDEADSTRQTAPLKAAEDAILFDTTGQTKDQSLEMLIKIVKERL